MSKIIFCLLLVGIGFCAAQNPQFKIAFDYNQVEILKNDVLKPFITEMPSLGLNWTLPVNISGVTGNISNLTVLNATMDFENTHLLEPYNDEGFAIEIKNLSVTINYDAKLRFEHLPYITGTNNNLTIESLDIFLAFGFVVTDDSYYTYIEDASIVMQNIDLQLSGIFKVISDVVDPLESEIAKILSDVATSLITKYNETLIAKTSYGIGVTLFDTLQVNLTFANAPSTFLVGGDTFASLAFNLDVTDIQTGVTAPSASDDSLPNYIDGGLPIQFIIGEEMISQIVWSVFNSGKVNLTISNATAPPEIPVHLYTQDLIVLFPNITQDWGENKGCYINIQSGGDNPIAFIRDGRLVLDVPIAFSLYVDQNSSQYPKQGLANCTDCTEAFSLNMSAFVAVVVYGINETAIGAKVLDIDMNQMSLIQGKVNATDFQNTLNGLLVPIAEQLNEQIGTIVIPYIQLIELYGPNDLSLFLGEGFLQFGLSIVPKNTTTYLPFPSNMSTVLPF